MGTETLLETLSWDSEHFGCRIARVVPKRLTAAMGRELEEQVEREEVDCLYLLADAKDQETIRVAESTGFRLVDIRLNLEADQVGGPSEAIPLPDGISMRSAVESDLPILKRLSRSVFRHSRFYRDPHFPDPLCDRLYERWIENLVAGDSAFVLVADLSGTPVGYTACRLQAGVGEIDLLSVSPEYKTRGLGQALLETALRRFAEAGADRILSVTQGQNLKAQRVAMRAGIFPIDVELWYHRWSSVAGPGSRGAS